jgi:S1-C subfamily serine protease
LLTFDASNSSKADEQLRTDVIQDNRYYETIRLFLKQRKYIDTLNIIRPSYEEHLKVEGEVRSICLGEVRSPAETKFFFTQCTVLWRLMDIHGQLLDSLTITTRSGDFSENYFQDNSQTTVKKSIEDALERSAINLVNNEKTLNRMTIAKEVEKGKITMNAKKLDSADISLACVTVRNGNKAINGLLISNDGFIIINFHELPSNITGLSVTDASGKVYPANLIRTRPDCDIALLKVEGSFPVCFRLATEKSYRFGDQIQAYAYRKSNKSKLILSGVIANEKKESHQLQLDITLGSRSEGAPIFSKMNTQLIGIVNNKLSGHTVEGIAFATPAYVIKTLLEIEYVE